MAGVVLVPPKFQFLDAVGNPLANGKVDVYLAGTTTRTPTWQDQGQSVLNTNPIILDANGSCTMVVDDSLTYKLVVKNSANVEQTHAGGDNIVGGTTRLAQMSFTQAGSGAVARSALDKMRDVVNVKDFGAVGDGTTDDSTAIQAALNTGRDVHGAGNFRVGTSLYMQTGGQRLVIDGEIRMDASLGKPCLYLGATSSAGAAPGTAIINASVQARFVGNGAKTDGSAAVSFVKATTTRCEIRAKGFYAGIEARGLSLVNTFLNCDLRQNVYGVYDRCDASGSIDLQGSRFFGGRIEQNANSGVRVGSSNIGFIGTVIEGNSNQGEGGTGADPEVLIEAGLGLGGVTFTDCYMETLVPNTSTAMIQVAATAGRYVQIIGGNYYARGAATRYIIESLSLATEQSFLLHGGQYKEFKNFVKATITGNSFVHVQGVQADLSRDASTDVTASNNALVLQSERHVIKHNARAIVDDFQSNNLTSGLSQYALKDTHKRVTFGAVVASGEIIPAAQISQGAIHVFEVLGVGRNSSTVGGSFLAYLTVAGNAAAPGSILNTYIANQYNASGTSIGFAVNGSDGIDVNTLAGGHVWDFYIRRVIRV